MASSVITIERHIIEQERKYPHATGAFSNILYDIALAAKIISNEVNKAGLLDILGATDETNVHGERVQLDVFANEVIFKALTEGTSAVWHRRKRRTHRSREVPDRQYVLLYARSTAPPTSTPTYPSARSSRSIRRSRRAAGIEVASRSGASRRGRYVVYGSSTMLVYTTGTGVHGFTLDPAIGEFILSHPDIKIPSPGQRIYSCNEGNYVRWSPAQRRLVDHFKGLDGQNDKPFSSRYIGSLVADFHRTLLYGGIFMYPADAKSPNGKLRLLYEAAPIR